MVDRLLGIFLALCIGTLALSLIAGPKAAPMARAEKNQIISPEQLARISREEAILNRHIAALNFDGVPLGDALNSISRAAGIKIGVDWSDVEKIGLDETFPIHLHLSHVSLRRVLRAIGHEVGQGEWIMDYAIDINGNTITFSSSPAGPDAAMTMEIYNIRPLIEKVVAFPPIGEQEPPLTREDAFAFITAFIRENVDPDSWPVDRQTMHNAMGLLVVTQTRKNQDEIARLLTRLDAQMGK